MPIETIDLSDSKYDRYLRGFYGKDWTLCVGAGICRGILPDWAELTRRLTNKCFRTSWNSDEFRQKSSEIGFSLDSWIQGCYNKMLSEGKTLTDFNKVLEDTLYEDLLLEADRQQLRASMILLFNSPKMLNKKQMLKLCDFFESKYSSTTLLQLVFALIKRSDAMKLPSSIVTFNADCLLYSLLGLFEIKMNLVKTGKFSMPPDRYKRVTRKFQTWSNCIPIFHLHGSLSPTGNTANEDSRDSLIFLESSYSEVAGSMYSWAQTSFLYLAQCNKLVFLGLSMSDPNIRKWLAWTHQGYIEELNLVKSKSRDIVSLNHLWIRTKASSPGLQTFLDISLRHLGVKIGLINSWSDLGSIMSRIM